eukprot:TRINITY_DN21845_c0_g1_i1.p1 TRINITY_DN21845_c0_g1~~TRINITY_DN21845_c0_g1_i1.p1  ORF type:complete len:499 (+),score=103.35 TRINITY_DN21845_c0_g1_i1:110-1498(+)
MGCGASAAEKYGPPETAAADAEDEVVAFESSPPESKLATIKGNPEARKQGPPAPLEDSFFSTVGQVELSWAEQSYSASHIPKRGVLEPCGLNIKKDTVVEVMMGTYAGRTARVLRNPDAIGTVSLKFEKTGEEMDFINTKHMRVKGAVPPDDVNDLSYGPCFGPEMFEKTFLKRWSLDADSLRPGQRLDNTDSAIIYTGELGSRGGCTEVIIKRVNIRTTKQPFQMHVNEVRALARLSHPCLIRFYGVILTPTRLDMVLEYCTDDDIRKCVQSGRSIPFPCVMCDVVCGLSYMHGEMFCHLDIKPDNVLITMGMRGKLCDFGTATRIGLYRQLKGQIGTPGYRAPEVEQGMDFDAVLADTWSFGRVIEYVACYDSRLDIRELVDAKHETPLQRTPLMRCLEIMKVIEGSSRRPVAWTPKSQNTPKVGQGIPRPRNRGSPAVQRNPVLLESKMEEVAEVAFGS